jgi:hypothetical protein
MTTKSFKNPGDKELRGHVWDLLGKYPTMSTKALLNQIRNNEKWNVGLQQVGYHRTEWLLLQEKKAAEKRRVEERGLIKSRSKIEAVSSMRERVQEEFGMSPERLPVETQQKLVEDWVLENPKGTIFTLDAAIGDRIPDVSVAFVEDAMRTAQMLAEPPPKSVEPVVQPAVEEQSMPKKPTKLGRGVRQDARDEALLAILAQRNDLIPTPSDFGNDLPDVAKLTVALRSTGFKQKAEKSGTMRHVEDFDIRASLRRLKREGKLPQRRRTVAEHPPRPPEAPPPMEAVPEARTPAPPAEVSISFVAPPGSRESVLIAAAKAGLKVRLLPDGTLEVEPR